MRSHARRRFVMAVVALFGLASLPLNAGAAGPYHVTVLGEGFANAINEFGQVLGTRPGIQAYLWTPSTKNGVSGSSVLLGKFPGSTGITSAEEINSMGQITGFYDGGNGAYLWTPTTPNGVAGTFSDLGKLPDGTSAHGRSINGYGQVAGLTNPSSAPGRAMLFTPALPNGAVGSLTDLGTVVASHRTEPLAINRRGQVVGVSEPVGPGATRPFLWSPSESNGTSGEMVELGLINGAGSAFPHAINDAGMITGNIHLGGRTHGFLWTPDVPNGSTGSMVELEALGNNNRSFLRDINNLGQMVGSDTPDHASSIKRATLWTGGEIFDLNALLDSSGQGCFLTEAMAINDAGQIVAWGSFNPDGPGGIPSFTSGFLLTPIPEPGVACSILVVLIPATLRRRQSGL